jgi:hypothetical protein
VPSWIWSMESRGISWAISMTGIPRISSMSVLAGSSPKGKKLESRWLTLCSLSPYWYSNHLTQLIAIPFIISYAVDMHMGAPVQPVLLHNTANHQGQVGGDPRLMRTTGGHPQNLQFGLPPNLGWYKIGGTVLAMLLVIKLTYEVSLILLLVNP